MNDTADSTQDPFSAVEDSPFDRQKAQRALGSETLLKKVAALFLRNSPRLIDEIKVAIETNDSEKLQRTAHTLVSSLAYLSAKTATDAALFLENVGRTEEMDDAASTYNVLQTEAERLKVALRALLDEES